jgi:hypothetical protein
MSSGSSAAGRRQSARASRPVFSAAC